MQLGLVVCTGLGFLLTSLKLPHYGVIANLVGQVFWLYSSYRAWREPNWNFHKYDLHYVNSGVRSDELLAVRRDVLGKKLVAMVEPARNSCLALVLQHSHIASCRLGGPKEASREGRQALKTMASAIALASASIAAQPAAKTYRIGTLTVGPPIPPTEGTGKMLVEGLAKRGYRL